MYRTVDIIIPIYNAYDDLRLCVESVKKYTDLSIHRLILINDCSSDERIVPFLKEQESDRIIVIENEKNKGFSGNVNAGIQYSENTDVLLLNSDTIVTRNWLEKIISCAYSSPEIGTVTPMSNAATLCSVPEKCVDNKIPENLSLDEFAELVERCSLKKYPRITVAVGFCMFIKREVIKEVGLFDAETFGRGYGEENDFCNRTEQLGYIHVMCDDTLVYHKGTVSFLSEEKQKLLDAHAEILQKRYPGQMRKNHQYANDDSDHELRDNLKFYLNTKNGKKNILYLIHSDFREDAPDHVGGTQLHLKDLAEGVMDDYNVFVMARNNEQLQMTAYFDGKFETMRFNIGEKPLHPIYRSKKHYEIYRNILNAFDINLVHIQHLHGLTFDLAYAAKDKGIPVYLTLHDFYYMCYNEKLLDKDFQYSESVIDTHNCQKCLEGMEDIYDAEKYQKKWEEQCRKLLNLCDGLITPSESAKNIYVRYYPELKEKIHVISHGAKNLHKAVSINKKEIMISDKAVRCLEQILPENDPDCIQGWAFLTDKDASKTKIYVEVSDKWGHTFYYKTTRQWREDVSGAYGNPAYELSGFRTRIIRNVLPKGNLKIRIVQEYNGKLYTDGEVKTFRNREKPIDDKNLNVAFVGGMAPAKGSRLAYELIKGNKDTINWFVFGDIGDKTLKKYSQENLYKTGGYSRDELPELYDKFKIDLVCVLSVWPETFCYTISEALLCGIPVMVSKLGAMGERIEKNGCGIIVDVQDDIRKISAELNCMAESREQLEIYKNRVKGYTEKTIAEMCGEYKKLYEKTAVVTQKEDFDAEMLFEAQVNK